MDRYHPNRLIHRSERPGSGDSARSAEAVPARRIADETTRQVMEETKLFAFLVLQIGNDGMIHFIIIHDSPSNPQQPIHSLLVSRTSKLPIDVQTALRIHAWRVESAISGELIMRT